jgi:hypothetical protein
MGFKLLMRGLHIKYLAAIFLPLFFSGCLQEPLLEYDLKTPSTALLPIKYSRIIDERARFREIFCAIQQDHGFNLPDDRPCEDALYTLADEPLPEGKIVHLGNAQAPYPVYHYSWYFAGVRKQSCKALFLYATPY